MGASGQRSQLRARTSADSPQGDAGGRLGLEHVAAGAGSTPAAPPLHHDQKARLHTRVELASSNVHLELPAGSYSVEAAPSESRAEPVIPVLSSPKLVVVAAGRATTVNVNVGVEQPAQVAALAALER